MDSLHRSAGDHPPIRAAVGLGARVMLSTVMLSTVMLAGISVSGVRGQEAAAPLPIDYSQLADASVAERLELTDVQRAEVTRLLDDLAQRLAAAPRDQWPSVRGEIQQQLAAVLTELQRTQFNELRGQTRLRFNFRDQNWTEVLNWFARQADLSLVMDKTPPGNFTYSDTRDYSAGEAIDLLNSVLLTKGYTLIRRDRMLIVAQLGGDLPTDLVPRVTLDELAERGRFEIVSVLFPLGERPADAVMKEVQTLVGPYGKVVALPQTRQLLVIETAGKIQAINTLINSIPDGVMGPGGAGMALSPGAVFRSYPVPGLDGKGVVDTLQRLVGTARMTYDARAEQLSVVDAPQNQQVIAAAVEQMLANARTAAPTRLEIYPVRHEQLSEVSEQVRQLHPSLTLTVDNEADRLLIVASDSQHAAVKDLLEKLETAEQPSDVVVIGYTLEHADAEVVSKALTTWRPQLSVQVDTRDNRLVVGGRAADQPRIAAMIEQLDIPSAQGGRSTLEVYTLKNGSSDVVAELVRKMFPAMEITADRRNRRLMATGSPRDHEKLRQMLERVDQGGPGDRTVETHSTGKHSPTGVRAILQQLVPDAVISADPAGGRVFVWGDAEDQTRVKQIMQQVLQPSAGPVRKVRVFPLNIERISAESALDSLDESLTDNATIEVHEDSNSLIVRADDERLEQIEQALQAIETQLPAPREILTKGYPLQYVDPFDARTAVAELVPRAKLTSDSDSRTILVAGTPAEHDQVAQALKGLDVPRTDQRTLKTYSLAEVADAEGIYESLERAFRFERTARLSFQEETGTIYAYATPAAHQTIQQLINDARQADHGPPQISRVYSLRDADAQNVSESLEALYRRETPRVAVEADRSSNSLVVNATAAQHTKIADTLKQLEGQQRQVEVFALTSVDALTAETAVNQLFQNVPNEVAPQISSDLVNAQLFVRGTTEQVGQIRDLLTKMGEEVPDANGQRGNVRRIPFDGDIDEAMREIERVWPQLRANRIDVVKPGGLRPNSSFGPLSPKKSTRSPLPSPPARSGPPGANIARPRWATIPVGLPADEPSPPNSPVPPDNVAPETETETDADVNGEAVAGADATGVAPGESQAASDKGVESPSITIAPYDGGLTISSSDREALDQLESLLRAMSRPTGAGGSAAGFGVYFLGNISATEVERLLNQLIKQGASTGTGRLSGVSFAAERRLNALIVYGPAKDRRLVEDLLQVLDSQDYANALMLEKPTIVPVRSLEASDVMTILEKVYRSQMTANAAPRAADLPEGLSREVMSLLQQVSAAANSPLLTLSVDANTNSLIVRAPDSLRDEIVEFVRQLEAQAQNAPARRIEVIQLHKTRAQSVQRALERLTNPNARRRQQ